MGLSGFIGVHALALSNGVTHTYEERYSACDIANSMGIAINKVVLLLAGGIRM